MAVRKKKSDKQISLVINKDFLVDESLFIKEKTKKTRIILNDTCRFDLSHHIKSFDLLKIIPHYTIDRDGMIYEHIDINYFSNYYPEYEEINKSSIIISLVNAGGLIPKTGIGFINWALDNITNSDDVHESLWKTYRYWHKYTNQQQEAVKSLVNHISSLNNNIKPINIFGNIIYDERALEYEGVVSESNIFQNSYSLNPSFIWVH